MWACLCVGVNWACSYVSVLMCFCVFLRVHVFEWICKHVHDGSMFTSEWRCNHDDLCELVTVYIYFWINAWMYVWMLIICMYTTVLMSVLVSLWSGSVCVYVNMFMFGCKWVYTCDHIPVFEWICKHIMYFHECEWMYALYLCFCTFVLARLWKKSVIKCMSMYMYIDTYICAY